MNKTRQWLAPIGLWMLAAILTICGGILFSGCTDDNDNPVVNPEFTTQNDGRQETLEEMATNDETLVTEVSNAIEGNRDETIYPFFVESAKKMGWHARADRPQRQVGRQPHRPPQPLPERPRALFFGDQAGSDAFRQYIYILRN